MKSYLTVVYAINDSEAFKPELERLKSIFGNSKDRPFSAEFMSVENEAHRLDLIEQAYNDDACDIIDTLGEILGASDIHKYESYKDIK